MTRLTFKEFAKLPRSEQNARYPELSDHDKFMARLNDWGESENVKGDPYYPTTQEEIDEIMEIFGNGGKPHKDG